MATKAKRPIKKNAVRKTVTKSAVRSKPPTAKKSSKATAASKAKASKVASTKKVTRKKPATKLPAKKSAARKSTKSKVAVNKSPSKSRKNVAKPAKAKPTSAAARKTAKGAIAHQAKKTVAKKKPTAVPSNKAVSKRIPVSTKAQQKPTAKRINVPKKQHPLSAQQKKTLATTHLWAALEEKKRRDAQPAAWQTIVHHDHPTPATATPSALGQTEETVPVDAGAHQRDRSGS